MVEHCIAHKFFYCESCSLYVLLSLSRSLSYSLTLVLALVLFPYEKMCWHLEKKRSIYFTGSTVSFTIRAVVNFICVLILNVFIACVACLVPFTVFMFVYVYNSLAQIPWSIAHILSHPTEIVVLIYKLYSFIVVVVDDDAIADGGGGVGVVFRCWEFSLQKLFEKVKMNLRKWKERTITARNVQQFVQ